MKPETLLLSLNEIDEDLLAASEQSMQIQRKRPFAWIAVAAALVLVLGLGGFAIWRTVLNPEGNGTQAATRNPSAMQQTPADDSQPGGTKLPEGPRPLTELAIEGFSPDQLTAEGVQLAYEGENVIIFHGNFGLVCYDLSTQTVVFSVDYRKVVVVPGGTDPFYYTEYVHIEVSADGSAVSLNCQDVETGQRGTVCMINTVARTYEFLDPDTTTVPPLTQDGETRTFEGYFASFGNTLSDLIYLRGNQRWFLFHGGSAPDLSPQTLWELGDCRPSEPLGSLTDVDLRTETNLWTQARAAADPAFRTLPVFENQWFFDSDISHLLTLEQMMELTDQIFASLGVPDFHVEINPPADGAADPETLTQRTDDYTVTVTNRGRVTIEYTDPIPYPESPEFDRNDPRQVQENYANFLFASLEIPWSESWELDVQSTQASASSRYVSGRETSPYEERFLAAQLRNLALDLGPEQQLLRFSFDAEPDFRAHYLPLGDYPILSVDEATALLRAGQYLCAAHQGAGYGFDVSKAVADGQALGPELVYNTDGAQAFLLPWYRWWVPIDAQLVFDDAAVGSVAYVPVYVPAIAGAIEGAYGS